MGTMSSTVELNICPIIARIKKSKSIIKKKEKEVALLAKINLHERFEFYSFNSLSNSYIERDYSHLIDVLRKYAFMKGEINKLETS